MRTVSPGEPILPALTAQWYNHTVKPHPSPPQGRPQPHRHQNEILAKCNSLDPDYTPIPRFDPVAIVQPINDRYDRECYVSQSGLDDYNWIITQAVMRPGQSSQPCVYTGLTYANVELLDVAHQHVRIDPTTKTLITAHWGKGLLLAPNATGPSLISIETPASTGWIIWTLEDIPAASSITQFGVGLGRLHPLKVDGSLETVQTAEMLVYNQSFEVIPQGAYYQAKNVNGLAVIDVVFCPPEEE